jgi:spore germination protein YaaH
MRFLSAACLAAALAAGSTRPLAAQELEALWYSTDAEWSVQAFLANADKISVVSPQSFSMDSLGVIWGRVDARVLARAREAKVKVIPLIVNPGFDQGIFHRVLASAESRKRAVRNITALCRDNRFDGIQFDFENINVADRDVFTAFSREVADSLHRVRCSLSAAVVPRQGEFPGATSYHAWIYANWRGAYDYKALAESMDFLSIMTYSQHTRRTPPGPVAGYPWMERTVKYLLEIGVPASRISLGFPAYSNHWFPMSDAQGPRSSGTGLGWAAATGVLARNAATPQWDETQKEAYAFWETDGVYEWLFLQDARAFEARLELVRRYKLRGYSVWQVGQEDPKVWSLPRLR